MNDIVKGSLFLLTLFAILILQQAYENTWFDKSLTIIPNIQEGATIFAQDVWGFYSDFSLTLATVLPFLIPYYFIEQRTRSFYYVFVYLVIDGATSVSKLNYH